MTSPTAYFHADGDMFVPNRIARGPWGESVSGNYVGGLLGLIAERTAPQDPEFRVARFTVDLMRPVAMAAIGARTRVVRNGRRLNLVDAELIQNDTVVSRASALFLRRGPQPPDDAFTTPVHMPPLPDDAGEATGRAMLMWVYGNATDQAAPSTDLNRWQHDGPKSVWFRDIMPLVDGVPLTPFTRAAIAGDVVSSLTHFDSHGLAFINADYSLTLSRLPDGEYIGLSALTHYGSDGIGTGSATVFDRLGPIGTAAATALVNPGFAPPQR